MNIYTNKRTLINLNGKKRCSNYLSILQKHWKNQQQRSPNIYVLPTNKEKTREKKHMKPSTKIIYTKGTCIEYQCFSSNKHKKNKKTKNIFSKIVFIIHCCILVLSNLTKSFSKKCSIKWLKRDADTELVSSVE